MAALYRLCGGHKGRADRLGALWLKRRGCLSGHAIGLGGAAPCDRGAADATNRVEVKAYIDASGAKALFAGYEYAPRNAENVAVQTTNAEPLVDYNQMQSIMQGAIALTEDYAQIAAQNTQK